MKYKEVPAAGFLGNFVSYFWRYQHDEEDIIHTILPDSYFDLIADFEDNVLKSIHLTGIWTKPIDVTVTKGTVMLAIRFKVPAAEYLFQRDLKQLLNSTDSLPLSFWDIDTLTSNDFDHFVTSSSLRLKSALKASQKIDPRKIKLFELIYHRPAYTVDEISSRVGWSSRQMNRYFNQQLGIPLKTFLNMVRCKAAYPEIATGNLHPTQPYFDQSHYIKEVKKFTGTTPRALSENKNDRFLQLSTIALK